MSEQAARRRRSHWAWGYEDELPGRDELRATAGLIAGTLGFGDPANLAKLDVPIPAGFTQVRPPAPAGPPTKQH
jgi:hypothetical protein